MILIMYFSDDIDGVSNRITINGTVELQEEITEVPAQEIIPNDNGYDANMNYLIHPIHSHLLVYCSVYDSNGVSRNLVF